MHPEIFRIGPFALHSYGLMVFLGFATGIWLAVRRADRRGFPREWIYDVSVWILISSLAGARGLYIVTHLEEFRDRWLDTISPLQSDGTIGISGLVLLGGVLCAIVAIVIFARVKKVPLLRLMDILVPGLALGEMFGRIGCLMYGCCFGLPTHLPWGVIFPSSCPAGAQFPDTPLQPTQLYMSLSALLILIVLLLSERRLPKPGQAFGLYLTLYGPIRFVIEAVRWNESGLKPFEQWGSSITISQLLSIGLTAVGLWLLRRKGVAAQPIIRTTAKHTRKRNG